MKKPITIKLTLAQDKFLRELVETHTRLGDCKRESGWKLTFKDYEGVQAFRNKVFGLGGGGTRHYITKNAIIDKIDAAVREAVS